VSDEAPVGIRCIADLKCRVGESPVWDDATGQVLLVDHYGQAMHAVSPAAGLFWTRTFPATVGSLGLCRDARRWVVAIGDSVHIVDSRSEDIHLLVRPPPDGRTNRLNDGKVGPDGAFWVGSIDDQSSDRPTGALYRVTADGQAERIVGDLKVSNGLAWSADGRTLFHSDSRESWIDAWDFDPDVGAASGRRRIATPSEASGRPDGGATDVEGGYWSCGVSAGRINRYASDGMLIESFPVPIPAPTMPCFGGPDMRTLFFTSLREGLDAETLRRFPLSGGLFAMPVHVEGVPVGQFRY
jgi:sugar lactone lactonase YvrE